MKNRMIILIILVTICVFSTEIKAQNPYKLMDNNHISIYLQPSLSNLNHSKGEKYLISPLSPELSIGFNYIHSIKGFLGIGYGATIGYLNYTIKPSKTSENIYSTSSRLINLNIPFYLNKYYPFNVKHSVYVKAGGNINTIITSMSNIGNISTTDGELLYRTKTENKIIPQIGILFEVGGTYSMKNNNFLSFGLFINKNFINVMQVDYDYYENTSDQYYSNTFYSNASNFGLTLRYNFRTTIIDDLDIKDFFY